MIDRILVTSALPYVNGVKHLGNLAGSILPADVYARFQRLRGRDVLFICGTDEHGTPAELAAREACLPVAEYCARQHAAQATIYRQLAVSFDHFGRSSWPRTMRSLSNCSENWRRMVSSRSVCCSRSGRIPTIVSCPIAISRAPVRIAAIRRRAAISATDAAGCSIRLS